MRSNVVKESRVSASSWRDGNDCPWVIGLSDQERQSDMNKLKYAKSLKSNINLKLDKKFNRRERVNNMIKTARTERGENGRKQKNRREQKRENGHQ